MIRVLLSAPLVSSAPALLSFHMLTGKMGSRPQPYRRQYTRQPLCNGDRCALARAVDTVPGPILLAYDARAPHWQHRSLPGSLLALLPVAGLDLHRPLPAQHAASSRTPAPTAASSPSAPGRADEHVRDRAPGRGYRTALMGKYLNDYFPSRRRLGGPYVPPGWTAWAVARQRLPAVQLPPASSNGRASCTTASARRTT